MKKSKRIELTDGCIKYWAKKAIDKNSKFKPFVEQMLENEYLKSLKIKK